MKAWLKRLLKRFGFFPEPLTFAGIYDNPRTGELHVLAERRGEKP